MSHVQLASYQNSWYRPGRCLAWQLAWYFVGLPFLRSSVIPSSSFRVFLLRMFGARIGNGVVIKPGVRVKYPWHLALGDHCWVGEDCWIDNLTTVTIGNDVCLSQGAYLCTGNHDWSDPAFGLITKPITLEDGCWVGAKAFVAPGVVVETSAVASAGSVVYKRIPAREIHAGNPAVFVRERCFSSGGNKKQLVSQEQFVS
jgi:putative colanic acid biosynthesis acetyltransferase WcaF